MSGLVAAILLAVSAIVFNRLDAYFREQEERNLSAKAQVIGTFVAVYAARSDVILPGNLLDPEVALRLSNPSFLRYMANNVARADVTIEIGGVTSTTAGAVIVETAPGGTFSQRLTAPPEAREAPEALTSSFSAPVSVTSPLAEPWGVRVTLANPYTTRAYTLQTITSLLVVTALGALGGAILLAALIAGRFTRPLRRLTEATRRLGAGDLSGRVPAAEVGTSYSEVRELASQFNIMAGRLEESLALVRRDRDRSRDFLADVSHELRTPIAALRTFNELLREGAWHDDAAREEFLESSRVQLERLDWLAQNLLELSKLESGLLALDLRPEDLRMAVEPAVEQAEAVARRRGIELELRLAPNPLRVRHDPQRIGQVVSNLVGNALKFTPRDGHVVVEVRPHRDGAQIAVRDTGSGIDATELPHIFERFYRGSSATEARSSGSGLGLAIVKSIVDMHGGRIAVESRVGSGSTFTVTLVRDPRAVTAGIEPMAAGGSEEQGAEGGVPVLSGPAESADTPGGPIAPGTATAADRDVVISS